ncbi:metallophosphoesterase [Desulfurivibrio alkaliphilus AHT 2]|uniref:Metallophosphoesterase n=2 Tax=Desulfurivibrio alkaliphilus TaxID=427923 RepID=D6Z4K2_DESAT|nr:metallophosphoesterase [Desulfurivibrio alkaliphilus AHT 2]
MRHTYAIGDIHGCREMLERLLALIKPQRERDTVVVLGDFINRGPDSLGTVELLRRQQRLYRHFLVLRGNHEQMLLDYLAGRNREIFLANGGQATINSYLGGHGDSAPEDDSWLPPEHRDWLAALPCSYENEHGIFVHAGLQPGVHISQQSRHWLLWARQEFLETDHDFGKPVIFGHTPFKTAHITRNRIGIDTGAVYGGRLSCVVLPEEQIISV